MITSKTFKVKKLITLFNTIYCKGVTVVGFKISIKDSYNKTIQTWNANIDTSSSNHLSNRIEDSVYIPIDRFPYIMTNCVCFFSYDDDYGIGTKIITITSGTFFTKSYTINLHSSIFYDLTIL